MIPHLDLSKEFEDGTDCPIAWDEPEDEQDFLDGKTCNPNAPEECESCQ